MAIVDLVVKSGSSLQLSADDATVQHQMALLLHGDYTKWPIYSLVTCQNLAQHVFLFIEAHSKLCVWLK